MNEEQLRATRQAANEAGVPISIHLSESPFELQYSKDTYGATSIDFYESINFFDGLTIGAHVVWPTEEEIPILAERRVGVIHNPTSNMKIASGIAPVTAMLRAGVRVGLGTDGAASNNDLDMWEEMRLAAFLQKVDRMDPTVLSAGTVLKMATSGGDPTRRPAGWFKSTGTARSCGRSTTETVSPTTRASRPGSPGSTTTGSARAAPPASSRPEPCPSWTGAAPWCSRTRT